MFVGFPLAFAYVVAGILARAYGSLTDIWNLLCLVFFVLVALLLGIYLALVAGSILAAVLWLILQPLYKSRCALNGAPFHEGDLVRILVGRHKDQVVRINSTWRGDSVRVKLGEAEEEKFHDVFSPLELLRMDAGRNDTPPHVNSLSDGTRSK